MNQKSALVVSYSSLKKREDNSLELKASVLITTEALKLVKRRKHLKFLEKHIEKAKTKALGRPNIRTVMFM